MWGPSYAIPKALEPSVKSELLVLLDLDFIVLKKDGSVRLVGDYRKLNEVTVPVPFVMLSTEEVCAKLGKAKILSKLDLMKGFHQVPINPDSRKYTAFSTIFGKYQYKRMPFGVRNAPAVFQLLMQTVLCDLESFSTPYIDDVVIFSDSWETHLVHLKTVLIRLRKQSNCEV